MHVHYIYCVFAVLRLFCWFVSVFRYLFNGDIADRGRSAVEIFLLLFAFKLNCPGSVIINRGNHESADMNEVYGFAQEVRQKYGGLLYQKFQDIFHLLPLCVVLEKRVFIVHGGLCRKDNITLHHIDKLHRQRPCPASPHSFEDTLMFDLLWADPQPDRGRGWSTRGADCIAFGPDVTDAFLTKNNLEVCIRSHQVRSLLYSYTIYIYMCYIYMCKYIYLHIHMYVRK